ncbi:MAG TPA: AAA family ATPase, partial [Burkholderiales bacterium]|nr:AAA family ATPase [Burkholderiales bacterium]
MAAGARQLLLGLGKPLAVAFASGKLHSMILWGPPGVGKTTLARLMANAFNAEFIAISAVLAGVKEIRESVEKAKLSRDQFGRATIVFVDEVHRFNKAQQDAFLPHVESGLFTFIGATTENPSFEVNGALLSRAQVYVLESLKAEDLDQLIERGFEAEKMDATSDARKRIAEFADGDGR